MLSFFFGTGKRVWTTFVGTQLLFQLGGYQLQNFILGACDSPGLSLVLLGGWFATGVLAGLASGVWLGYLSGGEIFLADLVRDEMAEFDARIDGIELPETLMMTSGHDSTHSRAENLRSTGWWDSLSASFVRHHGRTVLLTFSHPGLAIIQLRNEDPNLRRRA